MLNTRLSGAPGAAAILLLGLLAACSDRSGPDAKTDDAPAAARPAPAAVPTEPPPVAARVQAMSAEQLAQAATEALRENRMYAPAGANAMEYYLALHDKQPDAAHVASALTDLLPYALIAAEQGIAREDFAEAQRLYGLLEKANPRFPALPRLRKDIADGQAAVARRAQAEAAAREQAEAARAQELQQRQAEERRAAEALAAQQQQAQEAARQQEAAARQERERQAAARAAEQQPPAPATTPRPAAAPVPAAAAAAQPIALRAVSTPSPRYPPEALRTGTGGEVVLEFTVDPDGSVSNVRVVRSEPARVFDREAVNAARRWRFEPIAASVTTRRTISFNPDG